MIYIPSKGDLVWLEFDPQAGHEQKGIRPALVISPREYNQKTGLGLFCPITSKEKSYPFEVKLPPDIKISGVILTDQIKNLDWKVRKVKFICRLSDEYIQEVQGKIRALIGYRDFI